MHRDVGIQVEYRKPKLRRRKKRQRRVSPAKSANKMTLVTVDRTLQVGVSEYRVRSSNLYDLKMAKEDWAEGTWEMVRKGRLRGGADKGRVLYMTKEPSGALVAVLVYHVESNTEIRIRAVSSSLTMKDREEDLIPPLIACCDAILRNHPERHGAANVVCPDHSSMASLCRASGFRQAGRGLLVRRTERT